MFQSSVNKSVATMFQLSGHHATKLDVYDASINVQWFTNDRSSTSPLHNRTLVWILSSVLESKHERFLKIFLNSQKNNS